VVDADTGEPLVNAAVVVVWHTRARIGMDAPRSLHAVRETVTDAAGHFTMAASGGIDWNPLTFVLDPDVVVYKPGYEPLCPRLAVRRGFRTFAELDRDLRAGATIRLPRLSRPECERQRGLVTDLVELASFDDVPHERIPRLLGLLSRQRERCGLQPYAEGGRD
jgi:hypothetical protein